MNGGQLYVSVVEPLNPAIERVKTILLRPFDLGKWFTIGFCVWLAEVGRTQNGGSRGGGGKGGGSPFHDGRFSFEELRDGILDILAKAQDFVPANLYWIIPAGIAAIILGVFITWVSSRGRFMFLHCVVENKAEVAVPWKKFSRHADSLFVFRLVLGVITLTVVSISVYIFIQLLKREAMAGSGWTVAMMVAAVFIFLIALGIVLFIIGKFTTDFVVPIMSLRTVSCTDAWREFLELFSANMGHFSLYILFQIVIWVVIGLFIVAIVFLTFCLAALILGIPYIGTVLLLPIYVFQRSYSLYFFRQFGPSFNVFRSSANQDNITKGG